MPNIITIIIQTYNEEQNIQSCIASCRSLTDNILLIDTGSQDNTVNIANKLGVRVLTTPYSRYVEPARHFAIENVETDWILIVDADEHITPDLADEIKSGINTTKYTHFKIKRKNIFGKSKWLKHGGWWPDRQIRLINKHAFVSWPKAIHSTPQINGKMGYLNHPLIHFFHGDFTTMVAKTIIFEDVESDLLYQADRPVKTLTFFRKFIGELFRRLIKKSGFLDGDIGIIEAIYQAFSKTITYLYLYEKKNRRTL